MQKYCYFVGFIDIFEIVYKTVEIHCVLLHLVKSRNQWKTIAFIVIFDIMELVNKTVKKTLCFMTYVKMTKRENAWDIASSTFDVKHCVILTFLHLRSS